MSHYHTHIALVCFLIACGIQFFSDSMQPTALQAARLVQIMLCVLFIYFAAQMIVQGGL